MSDTLQAPPCAPDAHRRQLTFATVGVGGAGIVAAAVPFVSSFAPASAPRRLARR